jgi:DNA-binding transcriptional regulator GbsR (MarR family)
VEENTPFITDELMGEIPVFENFLHRIGFKRVDGAVFGLLVLSARSLTSEEIEKTLNLSQSAVSLSLKNLIHFGAVEIRDSRQGRAKLHRPRENALAIVSTVFRKREQEAVMDFKAMAERALKQSKNQGSRYRRLQSILATCELAEAVMHFVFSLSKVERLESLRPIVSQVPRSLDLLVKTTTPLASVAQSLGERLRDGIREGIFENFSLKDKQP